MQEELSQLIAWIREASPAVWGYAVRQVYVNAVMYFIWSLLCAAGAVGFFFLARMCQREAQKDAFTMWEFGAILGYFLIGVFGLFSIVLITSGIATMLNPEWPAIELLLDFLKQ